MHEVQSTLTFFNSKCYFLSLDQIFCQTDDLEKTHYLIIDILINYAWYDNQRCHFCNQQIIFYHWTKFKVKRANLILAH